MMRYNRLIGLKQELEFLESGIDSQGRMQGKTTALCLKYLSEAISNPGFPVKIEDHRADLIGANRSILRRIKEIIKALDLKFIEINPRNNTIVFNLWAEDEITRPVQGVCPRCGGTIGGDNYTRPAQCEAAEVPFDVEADSGPYYCEDKKDE
jgi:hypothetical protein